MARSLVLSNGELAIALDAAGLVRDLYFPHVGYEDHVRGQYLHRVGVWVEGEMSWFNEDYSWRISVRCDEEALESFIVAENARLQLSLSFKDIVYNERSIFFRRVKVSNLAQRQRDIKLYFGQQFEIYKSHGGDTAYYDPASHSVVHYKGRRVFQVKAELDGELFSDYAIGISNFHGKEGAWKDAEDGSLSKNPIEHGLVDSVIGLYGTYGQGESKLCHYWLVAERSIALSQELNEYVTRKSPEYLILAAENWWKKWNKKLQPALPGLDSAQQALYRRSLSHLRSHVDADGGVIASLDSDMLQYGLDTYSYVWPRDGAYAALALDTAGDAAIAKRFLEFGASILTHDGYAMHKYLPDKSLGSSWHPWIRDNELQLPIQEDETALIVWAFYHHYLLTGDRELVEALYDELVAKPSEFMVHYRRQETGLPDASYDLWEEKRGSSTYTCSSVYGALVAAAELSKMLGKGDEEARYRQAAQEIRDAILAHLWDDKEGYFIKLIKSNGEADRTLDVSSAYGIFSFGVLEPGDPKLVRAWEVTARRLSQGIEAGGLARYEGDSYYRSADGPAGNPWILTTLWYAEYLIARAQNDADLARAREIFSWVERHAEASGVLPEQLDPKSGAPLSATPLAWSHAGYIIAVLAYQKKLKELGLAHKMAQQ